MQGAKRSKNQEARLQNRVFSFLLPLSSFFFLLKILKNKNK